MGRHFNRLSRRPSCAGSERPIRSRNDAVEGHNISRPHFFTALCFSAGRTGQRRHERTRRFRRASCVPFRNFVREGKPERASAGRAAALVKFGRIRMSSARYETSAYHSMPPAPSRHLNSVSTEPAAGQSRFSRIVRRGLHLQRPPPRPFRHRPVRMVVAIRTNSRAAGCARSERWARPISEGRASGRSRMTTSGSR